MPPSSGAASTWCAWAIACRAIWRPEASLSRGLGLNTPFGVIYSSNISSDRQTGIGGWTEEHSTGPCMAAMAITGISTRLLPYPWFTLITRADDDGDPGYLKSTAPVRYTPPDNRLPFPFNIRASLAVWNLLFLDKGPFKPTRPAPRRGIAARNIVNGPGHCGAAIRRRTCWEPTSRAAASMAAISITPWRPT